MKVLYSISWLSVRSELNSVSLLKIMFGLVFPGLSHIHKGISLLSISYVIETRIGLSINLNQLVVKILLSSL